MNGQRRVARTALRPGRELARGSSPGCIARALAILTDQLDNLIELFRVSNRPFYDQYQAARQTIDTGSPTPPTPPVP